MPETPGTREDLGLTEGEPLHNSTGAQAFGWSLVVIAFVLAIVTASLVIAAILFAGLFAIIPASFWLSGFSGP